MLDSMSLQEWYEWQAYSHLEPFDEEREDIRTAHIVSTIVNMGRDTKKHPTPFPLQKYLLKFGTEVQKQEGATQKQTWQQQKAIGRLFYERSKRKKRA